MSRLKNKMKDQNGFTLIEMLIVVAIIAILISVSIPMVSSSLERAKIATDAANERSAKAAALTAFLTGYYDDNDSHVFSSTTIYYYDAPNGKLVTSSSGLDYGKCSDHKNSGSTPSYICVKVSSEGNASVYWNVDGNTVPEKDSKRVK